jgi:hypothetical protein
VHIVVGTPGRIMDHLDKGTLDLSQLRFLVLDEADEMLNMGFAEDVETILAETPDTKQVALFSATMPAAIRRIAKRYLTDAAEISVKDKTVTAANTSHRYLQVAHQQKLDALTRILEVESFEAMIVFVRTKQATETLAERLRATATSSRLSASGPSPRCGTASSTSSSPRTWPPAGSTWSGSAMSSTTTSPPTPSPTCTGSGARVAPDAPVTPCRSSPLASGTCSRPSRRPPARRSPR